MAADRRAIPVRLPPQSQGPRTFGKRSLHELGTMAKNTGAPNVRQLRNSATLYLDVQLAQGRDAVR